MFENYNTEIGFSIHKFMDYDITKMICKPNCICGSEGFSIINRKLKVDTLQKIYLFETF